MRFDTIHRYNDEIKRIDKALDDLKEDIEKHPDKTWNYIHYVLLHSMQESLKEERDRHMYTPSEEQLQGELSVLKNCYSQIYKELVEAQDEKLEAQLKLLLDFTQQINCSILVENHILIEKLHEINQLLIELYNYTQSIENNDELAIARADAQLQLIKKIIDEVEKI